ncbi:MAG: mechanosensitive ion channel family protein [Candidatus Thiodiazotropha sp. (ex Myrtea spinifera)]|nr:mechanosensitive ion channel family protein [Candidatus Thiodiazotropha sp. (ex Myrtea spinifera)]
MTELLEQTYYGNTLQTWLIALGIIVLSALLGKVVYWVFSRIVRGVTSRTKSKLDDIIVDMVEEPVVFLLITFGIWFGLSQLTLPEILEVSIGNAYHVIFALLIGWMLSRLFDAIYQEYLVPWASKTENDLDDQLLPVLSKGVKMIIWAMAVIIGLNNAGYNVGALIAGLGIGGLALAMAAKDTVSNIFGGFTIFSDQPFKINDRVKVAGYDGTVSEIGVRSTRLRTLEGREVTIPNAKFADAPVENVTREPSRKVVLNLGLTYDTTSEQMQQALDLLREIHEDNPGAEDKVSLGFNGFGDFSLNILFIYYIRKGADILSVQTEMNMAILRAFNEKGLEFAFPTQTIYTLPGAQEA